MCRGTIKVALMAVMCLLGSSCDKNQFREIGSSEEDELVEVNFCADWYEKTKSSVSSDPDAVSNFVIAAYRNGRIEVQQYLNPTSHIVSMKLVKGAEYGIYALANVGDFAFPVSESDLGSMKLGISRIADLDRGIPMCWSDPHYVVKDRDLVNLFFDRLVSEISFRLDPEAMDGIEVVSVCLKQGASGVLPFSSSGSRAEAAYQQGGAAVMDGDYASDLDIAAINSGFPITLYTLENCQGTLLPDNLDPMEKVPDSLSHPEFCTYLEILCRFRDESAMDGTVTYRIFPGEDDCSNFDLVRNHIYTLTLMLTPGGLREVSWRVENKSVYKQALGIWKFVKGMHEPDDMYVGESARLQVVLTPGLVKMLADDLPSCSVRLVRAGVPSDDMSFGKLDIQGNVLSCDIKADAATQDPQNRLYLYGPDGKPISDLIHESKKVLAVRKPCMSVSGTSVERPVVNGESSSVDIYLVDLQGRNLNSSSSYGFDLGKYSDLSADMVQRVSCRSGNGSVDDAVSTIHKSTLHMGVERSDGPSASLILSMENPGNIESLNREMSRLYGKYASSSSPIWDCHFVSSNAEGVSIPVSFDIVPVEIWHCGARSNIDGYPRGVSQSISDYRLVVSNPSGITLEGAMFYTGRHGYLMDPLRECSDVSFLSGDRNIPNHLVGSMTGFTLEPARAGTYESCTPLNPVTSVRKPMKSYHIQRTAGYTMSSPYAIRQKLIQYLGVNWQECIGDIVVKTVDGYPLDYTYSDFYNYTGGSYDTALSDIRYNTSRAWDAEGDMVWTGLNGGSVFAQSTVRDLSLIHSSAPLEFVLAWDSDGGFILHVNGDQGMRRGNIIVDLDYECTSTLKWRQNSNSREVTETYKAKGTPASYVLRPGEETKSLMTRYGIESTFNKLNQDYWHQSCDANRVRADNVYAVFPSPFWVDVTVTLRPEDDSWLPVTIRSARGTSNMRFYTLYRRTSNGTYPSHSGMTNPDGSSRGSTEASGTARRYADYTNLTSTTYTFESVVLGAKTFHRYDR